MQKSVPEGLRPQECERTKLREPLPVPNVPVKDEVQEEVTKMRNLQIKTSLEKDTTLNFPVWHENNMVSFSYACDSNTECHQERLYVQGLQEGPEGLCGSQESGWVGRGWSSPAWQNQLGAKKNCKKKALAKAKEAVKEALAKTPESESETKEAEEATQVTEDTMKAGFQVDLEKAKKEVEDAQGAMTAAASEMFAFYLNLLSPESKYAWNKIISEQMENNMFVNLQGVSLEGPRRMSCKSFKDCVMFHLLTVFPINAAEQEKYYIINVLKKPQNVNVRQFARCVEQLNAYLGQMPCFYYSPNANAGTKPKNIPFMEAELGSHVLWMCPI